MAKTIVVYNQKGGVGKSTCACCLANALGNKGKKTLLIDFDAQGSSTIMLNIDKWDENIPNIGIPMSLFAVDGKVASINDLLECIQTPGYDKKVKKAKSMEWETKRINYPFDCIPVCGISLSVAENAVCNPNNYIYKNIKYIYYMLKLIVDELSSKLNYDYIVIDANPSLSISAINTLMASDFLLIPTDMAYESIVGISAILARLKELNLFLPNFMPLGVVCQKYAQRRNLDNSVKEIIEDNGFEIFDTMIPDVYTQVSSSIADGRLITTTNKKMEEAYSQLADEVERRIAETEALYGEVRNKKGLK